MIDPSRVKPGIIVLLHSQTDWEELGEVFEKLGVDNHIDWDFNEKYPYRRLSVDDEGFLYWRKGSHGTYDDPRWDSFQRLDFADLCIEPDLSGFDSMF